MPSHSLGRTEFGNPENKGKTISPDEANQLLNDWVKNDRLRLHMHQVAHLMKSWAKEKEQLNGADQWRWELTGLLHDADWDQWPDQHCKLIIEELEKRLKTNSTQFQPLQPQYISLTQSVNKKQ